MEYFDELKSWLKSWLDITVGYIVDQHRYSSLSGNGTLFKCNRCFEVNGSFPSERASITTSAVDELLIPSQELSNDEIIW